jgi:hypothetical protein
MAAVGAAMERGRVSVGTEDQDEASGLRSTGMVVGSWDRRRRGSPQALRQGRLSRMGVWLIRVRSSLVDLLALKCRPHLLSSRLKTSAGMVL